MNLDNIKGIIEINGKKYDPKDVFKVLIENRLKFDVINDSLLIGRNFIDSSPELNYETNSCQLSKMCKFYEPSNNKDNYKEIESQMENKELLNSTQNTFFPFSKSLDSSKAYIDDIEIDKGNLDIHSVINSETNSSDYRDNAINSDSLYSSEYTKPEVKRMLGFSSVSKSGYENQNNKSMLNTDDIPLSQRSLCKNCGKIIDVDWRHCGGCGHKLQL
jgi:hypothetical protein